MNLCNGFGGIIHPILRGKKRHWKKREKLGEKSVAGKDGWGWGQMDSEQGNLWGGGFRRGFGWAVVVVEVEVVQAVDEGEEGSRGIEAAGSRRERRQSPALAGRAVDGSARIPLVVACKASALVVFVVVAVVASGRWEESVGPGSHPPPISSSCRSSSWHWVVQCCLWKQKQLRCRTCRWSLEINVSNHLDFPPPNSERKPDSEFQDSSNDQLMSSSNTRPVSEPWSNTPFFSDDDYGCSGMTVLPPLGSWIRHEEVNLHVPSNIGFTLLKETGMINISVHLMNI